MRFRSVPSRVASWGFVTVAAATIAHAGPPAALTVSYQGQLKQGGAPVSGVFDFQFTLRQADGVTLVDRTCAFDVAVVNGLFQAELEFAASSFEGSPRLLQLGVRNALGGIHDCTSNTIGFLFELLTPLQPITAAPYALHAFSAPTGSSLDAPDGSPFNALVVDNAGKVGIGTTSPVATLDVTAVTASARVTSSGTTGPSFQLVQPNTALVSDNLGRVSFSLGAFGADPSSRAEITYGNVTNDSLRFSFASVSGLTSSVERMRILRDGGVGIGTPTPANTLSVNGSADFVGSLGIGTTSPSQRLHVSNGPSGGASQSGAELLVEDNTSCFVNIMAPDASERGVSFGSPASSVHGGVYYTNAGGLNLRTNGNLARMIIDAAGLVGIGTAGRSIDAQLHVESENARVAKFDRFTSDGELVAFARDDGVVGNITVTGGVVSYNAFTGSHYAWSAANIAAGALVSMTGKNHRFGERADAEVVYGIQETARANAPACLGVHLGPMESTREPGPENPRLVAAVGNGELRVVDSGTGDIAPGDYLISSSVPGCAMKDDSARFPVGHIVARAAQSVDWETASLDEKGVREATISVLFTNFDRIGSVAQTAAVEQLRAELETLHSEKEAMFARVARLELLLGQAARSNPVP